MDWRGIVLLVTLLSTHVVSMVIPFNASEDHQKFKPFELGLRKVTQWENPIINEKPVFEDLPSLGLILHAPMPIRSAVVQEVEEENSINQIQIGLGDSNTREHAKTKNDNKFDSEQGQQAEPQKIVESESKSKSGIEPESESKIMGHTNSKKDKESEQSNKSVKGETENNHESESESEVSNEEVIQQRKLERERYGEVHYVDYPDEEKKPVENKKEKEEKSGKKIVKKIHDVFELLEGIADVGVGISIFGGLAAGGEG